MSPRATAVFPKEQFYDLRISISGVTEVVAIPPFRLHHFGVPAASQLPPFHRVTDCFHLTSRNPCQAMPVNVVEPELKEYTQLQPFAVANLPLQGNVELTEPQISEGGDNIPLLVACHITPKTQKVIVDLSMPTHKRTTSRDDLPTASPTGRALAGSREISRGDEQA